MLEKPISENYCASVVEIKNIILLNNCDNVCHTNIFGNLVIVGIDTKIDDIGLFFPPETELSKEFLSSNNLYRHPELNADKEKKGYFEDSGRVKTVKFRGNKSMGFFIPLNSLDFTNHNEKLKIGDCFDEINNVKICWKYIVKTRQLYLGNKIGRKSKNSKIIDNQFRFHQDISQLGKNIHRVSPEDFIQISHKLHGASAIFSKVLCKKKLSITEKILKFLGTKIIDTEYCNIYSSRKVIKNDDINTNPQHFYNVDIWGLANEKTKHALLDGLSLYGEIVGYLPNGSSIQSMGGKVFDYGCEPNTFDIYLYRATYTNPSGIVFEFSSQQLAYFCCINGLKAVPELYYGKAKDLFPELDVEHHWQENFLQKLQETYLEQDCYMCKNKLPAEGIVLRIERNDYETYKCKSFRFLCEETKELDKGIIDIENIIT